ncbi:polysaccharide pyruvyl transferase family protein [Candidatus Poribacteria bacterium]
MRRLLYIGCIGYQNMGDEACLEGYQMLMDRLSPVDWWLHSLNGYDFIGNEPFDAIALGGGTLLSPHGNLGDAAMLEAKHRQVPYFIFGTGLESIEWEGLPEEPMLSDFVEMVRGASLIGVRGPLSKNYLTEIGISAERIQVIGDPAVMLQVDNDDKEPSGSEQERWVGVNVGTSFGRVYGWDEERMCAELVKAIESIAAQGWGICLFPIWTRDLKIQNSVAEKLSHLPRVRNIQTVTPPHELMELIRGFRSVIAMKLHVGILSAAAGTPYIPWAYRPKVEDFATAIGVEQYVVRTNANAEELVEAWEKLQQDEATVRSTMATGVAQMRSRLSRFTAEMLRELNRFYPDAMSESIIPGEGNLRGGHI